MSEPTRSARPTPAPFRPAALLVPKPATASDPLIAFQALPRDNVDRIELVLQDGITRAEANVFSVRDWLSRWSPFSQHAAELALRHCRARRTSRTVLSTGARADEAVTWDVVLTQFEGRNVVLSVARELTARDRRD